MLGGVEPLKVGARSRPIRRELLVLGNPRPLQQVTTAAEHGIQRIRDTHHLVYSFLRHCGLSLW